MDTREAYSILHRVTEKGFDVAGIKVSNFRVLVKTLTSSEDEMVSYHASRDSLANYRLYRLAYATFVVEEENVLDRASRPIQDLVALYKSLPTSAVELIEELAVKLQNRYRRACDFVPGYTYSSRARVMWKARGQAINLSTEHTGVPGSSRVGIPVSVEAWALVNQIIDSEDAHTREMGYALLIASASNPDGVKKMGASLSNEKKLKVTEREALVEYGSMAERDRVLGLSENKVEMWTSTISTSKDLVKELNRQMTGEKDRHDLFMEKYIAKVRAEKEALEKKQLEEIELRRGYGQIEPVSGSFGVSDADMEAMQKGDLNPFVEARKKFVEVGQDLNAIHTSGTRVIGARRGIRSR